MVTDQLSAYLVPLKSTELLSSHLLSRPLRSPHIHAQPSLSTSSSEQIHHDTGGNFRFGHQHHLIPRRKLRWPSPSLRLPLPHLVAVPPGCDSAGYLFWAPSASTGLRQKGPLAFIITVSDTRLPKVTGLKVKINSEIPQLIIIYKNLFC